MLIAYPGGKNGIYTISSNVTEIRPGAFGICPGLTGITIPNSIVSIGDYAFAMCTNLPSVTIPASVSGIGTDSFGMCSSLISITVDTNNSSYSSLDGILFDKAKTILIQYPAGKIGSYTVPATVTSIRDYAFDTCPKLTSITFGNSVTNIGEGAFFDCPGLGSITIPASVTSIGQWAFDRYINQVYFQGNAPAGTNVFNGNRNAIVYYLPGTTGWGATFVYRPTVAWNPKVQTSDASFGVKTNGFGFTITGTTNFAVRVEACTNLTSGIWEPVQTATLNGGSFSFSDPAFTNYPNRYYRVSMPQ